MAAHWARSLTKIYFTFKCSQDLKDLLSPAGEIPMLAIAAPTETDYPQSALPCWLTSSCSVEPLAAEFSVSTPTEGM